MVTCRLLRIGVPFGCSSATRLQEGRTRPEWLSPTKPSRRASTRSTAAERSDAARSRTSPSQATRPVMAVALRIGTGQAASCAAERCRSPQRSIASMIGPSVQP